MSNYTHSNDSVHWYMSELTSRIVAESGIPSDRFHMGKIILQSLKDDPDMLMQIDAGTGQSETNSEALRRTIKCAISFRRMGLQRGDVMILMAPTHVDLAIPFYAALYLGIVITPIDWTLGVAELRNNFKTAQPKIIFCQCERAANVKAALMESGDDAKIVTFDGSDHFNFARLLDQDADEDEIINFRPADFDPADTLAVLLATSGTTGTPKLGAVTHKNFAINGSYIWCRSTEFPPVSRSLVGAPLQWLSAVIIYMSAPYMRFTRVQSSKTLSREHVYHMINTFKPQFAVFSPTLVTTLLKPEGRENCDLTCFKTIMLAGSAVHLDLITEMKKLSPETEVLNTYGISEITGIAFVHGFSSPPESCGKPIGCFQYKLVDIHTGMEIFDSYVNGELRLKGPGIFKEYYNKPAATLEVFEEGWFKTGDIFYRDDAWNFYFVERFKSLLKYKSHQISPVEIEAVIRQHPDVLDVVVTSIPDQECGDLPVACIVPRPGQTPNAQEIKDLVKASLSDSKQLRGGVVFMSQLPTTASTKIHRMKIKEMVSNMKRE